MNKIFSWITVILWITLIFYLSHQSATDSNKLSIGVTGGIVERVDNVSPDNELDIGNFNHIVRKNAHFFIYLVLGVLVVNALRRSGVYIYKSIRLAFFICVLYSITDELHQLFVPDRGAQMEDMLIDSAGAIVGIGVYLVFRRAKK